MLIVDIQLSHESMRHIFSVYRQQQSRMHESECQWIARNQVNKCTHKWLDIQSIVWNRRSDTANANHSFCSPSLLFAPNVLLRTNHSQSRTKKKLKNKRKSLSNTRFVDFTFNDLLLLFAKRVRRPQISVCCVFSCCSFWPNDDTMNWSVVYKSLAEFTIYAASQSYCFTSSLANFCWLSQMDDNLRLSVC